MCYYPAEGIDPDQLNREYGVSTIQAVAMFWGVPYGSHVLGADPSNYDEGGKFNGKEANL